MPFSLFLNMEHDRPGKPHKELLSVAAREQDSHNDTVVNDCRLRVTPRFKSSVHGIGHWYAHFQGWAKHNQPRQNVFFRPQPNADPDESEAFQPNVPNQDCVVGMPEQEGASGGTSERSGGTALWASLQRLYNNLSLEKS